MYALNPSGGNKNCCRVLTLFKMRGWFMGSLWQILYRVLSFEEVTMLECVLHCVELTLSGEGFGESKDSQLHALCVDTAK